MEPSFKDLKDEVFTRKDWLTYYKNIWTKNLTARSIDLVKDMELKAKNPEEEVLSDDQTRYVTVKERLENRKILVQDAIDLIACMDKLLAMTDEEYIDATRSERVLAVAEDMIPKTEENKGQIDPALKAEPEAITNSNTSDQPDSEVKI